MQVNGLALHGGVGLLGARQKQHVVDHPRQPLVFLQVRCQQRLVVVAAAGFAQRQLGLAHQVVEWRAHLVRQVFGKARQPAKAVLQPRKHLVQRLAQLLQLLHLLHALQPQVQVLHIDGGGACGQPAHRAQAALADRPAQGKGQQRAGAQRQPEFEPVGGQHVCPLGQQLARHQRERLPFVHHMLPGQPGRFTAFGVLAVLQLHCAAGWQHGRCHLHRVDFNQRPARAVQHPQQVALVAQHVGVELGALAQRLNAVAVANQRAHALDPADQRLVVAPGNLARQRLVQVQAQRAQQQHADQGKHQRQPQAE